MVTTAHLGTRESGTGRAQTQAGSAYWGNASRLCSRCPYHPSETPSSHPRLEAGDEGEKEGMEMEGVSGSLVPPGGCLAALVASTKSPVPAPPVAGWARGAALGVTHPCLSQQEGAWCCSTQLFQWGWRLLQAPSTNSCSRRAVQGCWIHTCAAMQRPEDNGTWLKSLHRSQGMTCSVLQPVPCQQINQTAPRSLCRLETAP